MFPTPGYCESFNFKLRDELLNGEVYHSLPEARVVIKQWRTHYDTARPHSSLGYRSAAPKAIQSRQNQKSSVPPVDPCLGTLAHYD